MAVACSHATQATGANDPSKQISKDAWNAGHTLTGLGDAAEKNTGTSAGTVAAGDHLHTGVYEPAGVSAADITDSTATGRAVVTAADAPAARTAIGAGTSSFDGAYASLSGKPTLGTAAATAAADYATAAQGATANSALQPAGNGGSLTGLTKTQVGLANADNTSDAAKPVSTAQQTALDLKANLAGPTFTGTVGGITAAMVGLGSVTNDAQTKAAVVPNTVPSAGQILVGNAGGTAYAPVPLGTDATLASTGALTIANNVVTYAKMQDVSATSRFIGRITAAAGDPEELTGTQATTLLDAFTSLLKGLVPASGGGTTNFLRADGTFAAPTASTPEVLQSTKEPAADVNVAANFSVFSDEEMVIGDGFEFLLETNASLVIV